MELTSIVTNAPYSPPPHSFPSATFIFLLWTSSLQLLRATCLVSWLCSMPFVLFCCIILSPLWISSFWQLCPLTLGSSGHQAVATQHTCYLVSSPNFSHEYSISLKQPLGSTMTSMSFIPTEKYWMSSMFSVVSFLVLQEEPNSPHPPPLSLTYFEADVWSQAKQSQPPQWGKLQICSDMLRRHFTSIWLNSCTNI